MESDSRRLKIQTEARLTAFHPYLPLVERLISTFGGQPSELRSNRAPSGISPMAVN